MSEHVTGAPTPTSGHIAEHAPHAVEPPLLDEVHILWKLRALTSPVNAAGLPALALPVPVAGRDAGPIPASVQLIGPRDSEERLLAAGARLERAVRA